MMLDTTRVMKRFRIVIFFIFSIIDTAQKVFNFSEPIFLRSFFIKFGSVRNNLILTSNTVFNRVEKIFKSFRDDSFPFVMCYFLGVPLVKFVSLSKVFGPAIPKKGLKMFGGH